MARKRSINKWYMIATISGKENNVIDALKIRLVKDKSNIIKDFYYAVIPHKTPTGRLRERNLFPGYIFLYMNMTDESWFMVRNTEYVTGLIGSSGKRTKPTPISDNQIAIVKERVIKIKKEFKNADKINPATKGLKIDDEVVVIKGEMINQTGKIVNINSKTRKVLIEIELFGKMVPTEFTLNSVKKISG